MIWVFFFSLFSQIVLGQYEELTCDTRGTPLDIPVVVGESASHSLELNYGDCLEKPIVAVNTQPIQRVPSWLFNLHNEYALAVDTDYETIEKLLPTPYDVTKEFSYEIRAKFLGEKEGEPDYDSSKACKGAQLRLFTFFNEEKTDEYFVKNGDSVPSNLDDITSGLIQGIIPSNTSQKNAFLHSYCFNSDNERVFCDWHPKVGINNTIIVYLIGTNDSVTMLNTECAVEVELNISYTQYIMKENNIWKKSKFESQNTALILSLYLICVFIALVFITLCACYFGVCLCLYGRGNTDYDTITSSDQIPSANFLHKGLYYLWYWHAKTKKNISELWKEDILGTGMQHLRKYTSSYNGGSSNEKNEDVKNKMSQEVENTGSKVLACGTGFLQYIQGIIFVLAYQIRQIAVVLLGISVFIKGDYINSEYLDSMADILVEKGQGDMLCEIDISSSSGSLFFGSYYIHTAWIHYIITGTVLALFFLVEVIFLFVYIGKHINSVLGVSIFIENFKESLWTRIFRCVIYIFFAFYAIFGYLCTSNLLTGNMDFLGYFQGVIGLVLVEVVFIKSIINSLNYNGPSCFMYVRKLKSGYLFPNLEIAFFDVFALDPGEFISNVIETTQISVMLQKVEDKSLIYSHYDWDIVEGLKWSELLQLYEFFFGEVEDYNLVKRSDVLFYSQVLSGDWFKACFGKKLNEEEGEDKPIDKEQDMQITVVNDKVVDGIFEGGGGESVEVDKVNIKIEENEENNVINEEDNENEEKENEENESLATIDENGEKYSTEEEEEEEELSDNGENELPGNEAVGDGFIDINLNENQVGNLPNGVGMIPYDPNVDVQPPEQPPENEEPVEISMLSKVLEFICVIILIIISIIQDSVILLIASQSFIGGGGKTSQISHYSAIINRAINGECSENSDFSSRMNFFGVLLLNNYFYMGIFGFPIVLFLLGETISLFIYIGHNITSLIQVSILITCYREHIAFRTVKAIMYFYFIVLSPIGFFFTESSVITTDLFLKVLILDELIPLLLYLLGVIAMFQELMGTISYDGPSNWYYRMKLKDLSLKEKGLLPDVSITSIKTALSVSFDLDGFVHKILFLSSFHKKPNFVLLQKKQNPMYSHYDWGVIEKFSSRDMEKIHNFFFKLEHDVPQETVKKYSILYTPPFGEDWFAIDFMNQSFTKEDESTLALMYSRELSEEKLKKEEEEKKKAEEEEKKKAEEEKKQTVIHIEEKEDETDEKKEEEEGEKEKEEEIDHGDNFEKYRFNAYTRTLINFSYGLILGTLLIWLPVIPSVIYFLCIAYILVELISLKTGSMFIASIGEKIGVLADSVINMDTEGKDLKVETIKAEDVIEGGIGGTFITQVSMMIIVGIIFIMSIISSLFLIVLYIYVYTTVDSNSIENQIITIE